ncbi:hypothetical protein H0H93_008778, partial [Arthromyces matolae]
MYAQSTWALLLTLPFSQALKLFPPASPVYLGTTVRVTWTSTSDDPPTFNLFAQCEGTVATPAVNATTSDGELFISIPDFFNYDVS